MKKLDYILFGSFGTLFPRATITENAVLADDEEEAFGNGFDGRHCACLASGKLEYIHIYSLYRA